MFKTLLSGLCGFYSVDDNYNYNYNNNVIKKTFTQQEKKDIMIMLKNNKSKSEVCKVYNTSYYHLNKLLKNNQNYHLNRLLKNNQIRKK